MRTKVTENEVTERDDSLNTVEMTDAQREAIVYYSKKLDKYFKNYSEMLKEEEAVRKQEQEEEEAKAKETAKKDKALESLKAQKQHLVELNKERDKLLEKFIADGFNFIEEYDEVPDVFDEEEIKESSKEETNHIDLDLLSKVIGSLLLPFDYKDEE